MLNRHSSFLHLNSLANCCDTKVKVLGAMKMTKTCPDGGDAAALAADGGVPN